MHAGIRVFGMICFYRFLSIYGLNCTDADVAGQDYLRAWWSDSVDSGKGLTYLLRDPRYTIGCCGVIKDWRIFIRNPGTFNFQVWRGTASGSYRLVGQNTHVYTAGEIDSNPKLTMIPSERISVEVGDILGWHTDGVDMVTYSAGNFTTLYITQPSPSVGDVVDWSSASTNTNKSFAMRAYLDANSIPSFVGAPSALSVQETTPIGTTVLGLSVTDVDSYDIPTLVVSMNWSSMFEIPANTSNIRVKGTLIAGTYSYMLTVTDHCGQSSTSVLVINILVSTPSLTSLPAFSSVMENVTTETLLHTLTLARPGCCTCSISNIYPTVPNNPFLVKTIPLSTYIGVYLKNGASLRYADINTYILTVSCTNGVSRTDGNLTVNVLPTNAPVFVNWQDKVSIRAAAAPIGTPVYTVSASDADSNLITFTATCTPTATCPFTMLANGEIVTSVDLNIHKVAGYIMNVNISDGYYNVGPKTLTITITGINTKPVITNLPNGTAVSVLEMEIVNHVVYQVSLSDPDIGDTHTWSVTFSLAAGGSMFHIGASNGTIITAAVLDYENLAVQTYSAIITVSDGRETSDAHVLNITVVDVNEAPVLSSPSYVIITPEVTSGTALGNPGIFSTDPDAGDTVTYSITCGTDSGYLSVKPTTGVVTMITAFDLDSQTLAIYTISCTLMATDSRGLMDTASLSVTVTDINDNKPQFSQAMYSFTLAVGSTLGTQIGQVTATDRDVSAPNNLLSYTLSSTAVFSIDSAGKIIMTGTASVATPYILTVTATDGGGLASTSTLQVLLVINTANSASTAERSNEGFFSYPENSVWFACAVVLGAVMFGMMGYLLYRYCKSKLSSSERQVIKVQPNTSNQQKEPAIEAKVNEVIAKPGTPLGNNIRVSPEPGSRNPLVRKWSPRVSPVSARVGTSSITSIYLTPMEAATLPPTITLKPDQSREQMDEVIKENYTLRPGSSVLIEHYQRHLQGK